MEVIGDDSCDRDGDPVQQWANHYFAWSERYQSSQAFKQICQFLDRAEDNLRPNFDLNANANEDITSNKDYV